MSVLIKGMKMPQNCYDCRLLYDCYSCKVTGARIDYDRCDNERLADCPLIELRNVANECYRGEVLYDAGIDAVLERSEE